MEPSVPTQHSHGDTKPAKPRAHSGAETRSAGDTHTHRPTAHTGTGHGEDIPLGAQGGDVLSLLPVLRGTERAQAQVPAACLWVGDPQAAEAGCSIN